MINTYSKLLLSTTAKEDNFHQNLPPTLIVTNYFPLPNNCVSVKNKNSICETHFITTFYLILSSQVIIHLQKVFIYRNYHWSLSDFICFYSSLSSHRVRKCLKINSTDHDENTPGPTEAIYPLFTSSLCLSASTTPRPQLEVTINRSHLMISTFMMMDLHAY